MKNELLNLKLSGEITWRLAQVHLDKKIYELNNYFSSENFDYRNDSLEIYIDLNDVTKVDMSALALIIEIEKNVNIMIKEKNLFEIVWLNVPPDLLALANLCGLEQELNFK